MGLADIVGDLRPHIAGQTTPLVVKVPGNPVFTTAVSWVAYGGCAAINDFDGATPLEGAVRLAQFTAPDGTSTPYPYSAATLMASGTNRVISMNHDLSFVIDPAKGASPAPARVVLLSNVIDYFGVSYNPGSPVGGVPGAAPICRSPAIPNPFNPECRSATRWRAPVR